VEPAEYGLAGLGWVAALARLDGRGVEARPELSRVGVDRTQLPGWTDEAVGVTISLLLLPAARLGKMLAEVSTPRVPRAYIRRYDRLLYPLNDRFKCAPNWCYGAGWS